MWGILENEKFAHASIVIFQNAMCILWFYNYASTYITNIGRGFYFLCVGFEVCCVM